MKKRESSTLIVLLTISALTLGGCSTSADSLFEANLKVLPNVRAYAGKNAEQVEGRATAATTARDAIENEVANTPEGVAEIMKTFEP